MASVFFCLWGGLTEGLSVQIDTEIINFGWIVINVIMSIPLIKQYIAVKLTPLEAEIYERDFKTHMTDRQFKHFISKFQQIRYKSDGSQLCATNSDFTHLLYVAKIFPGAKVSLTTINQLAKVKDISAGGWIGVHEYLRVEQESLKPPAERGQVMWGISAYMNKTNSDEHQEQGYTQTEVVMKPTTDEEGVVVYKIDMAVIISFYFLDSL
jgi:hypothetical protein